MLSTIHVPAGGRQLDMVADFFRYDTAGQAGADETLVISADGNNLGSYLPGDSLKLPSTAKRWTITPANPTQTAMLRFGLGEIWTSRLVGNVRVIDEFTDALTVSAQNPSAAPAAFASTQIVAPAANVRGMIVRAVSCNAMNGASSSAACGFKLAKSAPTGYNAPLVRWDLMTAYASGGVLIDRSDSKVNKLVPPGWGLYFFSEVVGASAALSLGGVVWYEPL